VPKSSGELRASNAPGWADPKSGRWDQAVRAWLREEHWLEPVVETAKWKDQAMKMAG